MSTGEKLPPWERKKIRAVSEKNTTGTEGENWEFTFEGKAYSLPGRFVQDALAASDDGRRWIAAREAKKTIREIVFAIAQKKCQVRNSRLCWKWAPIHLGQPHHTRHKKMGNAFGDDRIWIIVDGVEEQIRVWACPNCHRIHHNALHFGEVQPEPEPVLPAVTVID
jgi:hypothetical protein